MKKLNLIYNHSINPVIETNLDKLEIVSLEDEEVVIPCIYKYEKLFVPKQFCQNYIKSNSVIDDEFKFKHLSLKMDKIIRIDSLSYLDLEFLIQKLRLFILKKGTDEKINYNRRRFIKAYENQIEPLIKYDLLDIYFEEDSYREFHKELLKNGNYSYEGTSVNGFNYSENKMTVGIFVNSEGKLYFNLKDLMNSLGIDYSIEELKKNLEIKSQRYYLTNKNSTTLENFLDKKNLIKFLIKFRLNSELKKLKWYLIELVESSIAKYFIKFDVVDYQFNIKISREALNKIKYFSDREFSLMNKYISEYVLNYIKNK